MAVQAVDVINVIFNQEDKVCLRVFDDKKNGTFTGAKLEVDAGKFASIEKQLHDHNDAGRGIFFVVNSGGHEDASITKINAQYVECDDLSIEEQQKQIDAFPLPPSLIIKTRKSLHTYWLIKNGVVADFRKIQKGLVKHFHGDPMCVNESRVMRLPGFNHMKEDPVMVECIYFHPEHMYTQKELMDVLPIEEETKAEVKKGTQRGIRRLVEDCDFIKHCMTNAATLSEGLWYGMITNLAPFDGGVPLIHRLSAPYPGYNQQDTQKKINHFFDSGTKPMLCQTLAEKGFECPKMKSGECTCKAPASKCFEPMSVEGLRNTIKALPVKNAVVEDIQTAKNFVESFLYNIDSVTADSLINYDIKEHFSFKNADLKALSSMHKMLYKQYQSSAETKRNGTDIPDWYEPTERGLAFLPGVLAEEMAKENVFYAAGEFYVYQDGVYKPISDMAAQNMVREKMIARYTKLSQIKDAWGQWQMQIIKENKELNSNPYLINVKNGLYNVLEETLVEHTPDYPSTVQLQVHYEEGAECPRFMQYLHETIPDDQIPLIQEILGYLLIPVQHAQKCFVIIGKGGTGKSVLLRVVNEILLGRENVSNVSWQALNERFKIAELVGKLANVFADLPSKNLEDSGLFKALVGEDFLTVERKNKDPFSFQSYARLLFSCNSIPKNYSDKTEGFYRRLIILRFDNVVDASKRDPELVDKFRAEADGIFLFALAGLKRLMANGYRFSETQANFDELQKYREDSNSVLSFVSEWCEQDEKYEIPSMDLYNKYKLYCEACGMSPYAQKRFSQELENGFPNLVKGKDSLGKRRTWKGIKVSDITE